MDGPEEQVEDRAVGGWLALAVLGALLPWQSSMSSLGCSPGGVCGWVSGPNSVYVSTASAGPKSDSFWAWTVYLAAAVLGLTVFLVRRYFPRVHIQLPDLIGRTFYQAIGAVLLVSTLVVAGDSSSVYSQSSGSVIASTGPSAWIWVSVIAAIALCRGGYLFAGVYRRSHFLKRLLFDPYAASSASSGATTHR